MGMTQEKLQVKHFLNRKLGMSIAAQGRVFAHFNAELEYRIEQAKKDDKYDDGVVDMRGEKITFAPGYPLVLASDPLSKVPLHHYKLNLDRGLSYERACEMLDAAANDNPSKQLKYGEGFYISILNSKRRHQVRPSAARPSCPRQPGRVTVKFCAPAARNQFLRCLTASQPVSNVT